MEQLLQYGIAGIVLGVLVWVLKTTGQERKDRDTAFSTVLERITEKNEARADARNKEIVATFNGLKDVINSIQIPKSR